MEEEMKQNPTTAKVQDLRGQKVIDPRGEKVGTVMDVYIDDDTGQPEWLTVTTGMFGTKTSFVPIEGCGIDGNGDVMVHHDKATIKDAPRIDANGRLDEQEERQLYEYYGRSYETLRSADVDRTTSANTNSARDVDRDRSTSMMRSEEEVSVDKRTQEAGRVKLRKWVETEDVHITVPVQRQMARVVREPADGADADVDSFVEGEEEIVLSEEVVDVDKRVVGKERVGLETETVTEQVPVDETVRKERIEVEGAVDTDMKSRR
jgi:uncharacterized protein (TIGR02271 family)